MTLLAILSSIFAGIIAVILIISFVDWLLNHPAHSICKELPESKTEPCKHERFVIDKQIRVIECRYCGMRSWLEKDPVDLFPPKFLKP